MIQFTETKILGCHLVEFSPFKDERGFLQRLFSKDIFEGKFNDIKQINYVNVKKKGTVKGIHLQSEPYEEDKVVICLKGEIFDVAVDLRNKSKTFSKWYGAHLSEKEPRALLIPKGCGHAFQTLTDDVSILYLHSEFYNRDSESGLNQADKTVGIEWPLDLSMISDKDKGLPFLEKI